MSIRTDVSSCPVVVHLTCTRRTLPVICSGEVGSSRGVAKCLLLMPALNLMEI